MADEDDDEWRFSVDEVGPDDPDEGAEEDDGWSVTMVGEEDDGPTVGVATGDADATDDDGGGNVAGELAPDASVEPGTPALENVVFATLGAVVTALTFAALLTPLGPVTVGSIVGGITAGAGLLYLVFRYF